jgi:hypothetical protein
MDNLKDNVKDNINKYDEIQDINIRDINKLIGSLEYYDNEKITIISFACQTENYILEKSFMQQYPYFLHNFEVKKRLLLIDPNYWEEYPIVDTFDGFVSGAPKFIIKYTPSKFPTKIILDDNNTNFDISFDYKAQLILADNCTRNTNENYKARLKYIYKETNNNVYIECFQTEAPGFYSLPIDYIKKLTNTHTPINNYKNSFVNALDKYLNKLVNNHGILIFHYGWGSIDTFIDNMTPQEINIINKYYNNIFFSECDINQIIFYKCVNNKLEKINLSTGLELMKSVLSNATNNYYSKYIKYKNKYKNTKNNNFF